MFLSNIENQNEINLKLYKRNEPIIFKKNHLSFRSEETKYRFPFINNNKYNNCNNINYKINDFALNIDDENDVKNLNNKLTKDNTSGFIPDSNSDLYNLNIVNSNNNSEQLYPYLFKSYNNESSFNNLGIQNSLIFNNSSRNDLKLYNIFNK